MNLSAGLPIESPRHPVGRRTVTLFDPARSGRRLGVDLWYPAAAGDEPRARYELFPGVSFAAAHAVDAPLAAPGRWPLVLFSHGRTGMRISYSMLCEAWAARGAIVVSADHPGDQLADWLTGAHTDDRTNEVNRVADAHLVLQALLHGHPDLPVDLLNAIDPRAVVLAGHSYGAYTALATAAGARGVDAHTAVRAVIGFQPYTRSMSDSLLGRITVPALLVVSERDTVTPAEVDADRPWALLRGRPTWRLDLAGAGHQAASDIALYAELAPQVPMLPALVRDYLASAAEGSQAAAGRGWRELLALQLECAWAFVRTVVGPDRDLADEAVARLESTAGLTLRRR